MSILLLLGVHRPSVRRRRRRRRRAPPPSESSVDEAWQADERRGVVDEIVGIVEFTHVLQTVNSGT